MIGTGVVQSVAQQRTALVVEDDDTVRRMVERHLTRAGYVVRTASGEDEAVRCADGVDVAIVDLGLGQGSGTGVCERLRDDAATAELPIVVLTARDDLPTKLRLFAAGADDYVTKPFEPLELLARLEVVSRRARSALAWTRIGPLAVSADGDASLDGTVLALTAAERDLMAAFARHWPGTTPRAALRRGSSHRSPETSDNVIEVLVGRLRKKLAAAGGGVEVHVVRGAGYVLRLTRTKGMVSG